MTQLSAELQNLEECLAGIVQRTSGLHLAANSMCEFEEESWEESVHIVSL